MEMPSLHFYLGLELGGKRPYLKVLERFSLKVVMENEGALTPGLGRDNQG